MQILIAPAGQTGKGRHIEASMLGWRVESLIDGRIGRSSLAARVA